jgi:hypothetical protein
MIDKERLENMSPIGFDLNGNVLLKSEDYHWLMEQAERYEDLLEQVKQIEKVSDYNADLRMKYEKALEFYADKENYRGYLTAGGWVKTPVNDDDGEKARQALESDEN